MRGEKTEIRRDVSELHLALSFLIRIASSHRFQHGPRTYIIPLSQNIILRINYTRVKHVFS